MSIDRRNPQLIHPPTGAYSLLSVAPHDGRLAVASGQTGRRADGSLATGPGDQTTDAISNLRALIESTASTFDDVLLLRWLVVGRENTEAVRVSRDEILSGLLAGAPPPSSTMSIVVGLADPAALVEVEAWFVAPDE